MIWKLLTIEKFKESLMKYLQDLFEKLEMLNKKILSFLKNKLIIFSSFKIRLWSLSKEILYKLKIFKKKCNEWNCKTVKINSKLNQFRNNCKFWINLDKFPTSINKLFPQELWMKIKAAKSSKVLLKLKKLFWSKDRKEILKMKS